MHRVRAAPIALALALAFEGPTLAGSGRAAHAVGGSFACATGEARVAVVVDPGEGGSVTSVCVPAGARDNGATILAARASLLGRPQPRFNSSGLLCAIDGYPASGCGEQHGGRYAYWGYYHGANGGWSYSNLGPAAVRVQDGVVEGWRFHADGAGNPTDPPPRASADAAATCVPPQPPATGPAATAPGAPPGTAGAAAPPGTGDGGQPAGSGAPAAPPIGPVDGTTVAPARPATGPSAPPRRGTPATGTDLVDQGVAARGPAGGSGEDENGGGPPLGFVAGLATVAALGATALVVSRRRRAAS
jgi:hypothetical protein